jgi:hypothetical protein
LITTSAEVKLGLNSQAIRGQELGWSLEVRGRMHLFQNVAHATFGSLFIILLLQILLGQAAIFILLLYLFAGQKVLSHDAGNFLEVFKHLLTGINRAITTTDCSFLEDRRISTTHV